MTAFYFSTRSMPTVVPRALVPSQGPTPVVATSADRELLIHAVTFGGLPKDENGCIPPDLIWISVVRLSDQRFTTPRGLQVGDRTIKRRSLYPSATYSERPRAQYDLRNARGPWIGACSPCDDLHGGDYPRLLLQECHRGAVALGYTVFAKGVAPNDEGAG